MSAMRGHERPARVSAVSAASAITHADRNAKKAATSICSGSPAAPSIAASGSGAALGPSGTAKPAAAAATAGGGAAPAPTGTPLTSMTGRSPSVRTRSPPPLRWW